MSTRTRNFGAVAITIAVTGTPVQIMAESDARRFVTDFEMQCDSLNSAAMTIGPSTVDTTTYVPRTAGSTVNFTSANGSDLSDVGFDLSKLYVNGTATNIARIQFSYLKRN